jgi:hypothetical protein
MWSELIDELAQMPYAVARLRAEHVTTAPAGAANAPPPVAARRGCCMTELGIPCTVRQGTIGWVVVFHDPDGLEIHLYSCEHHGIEAAD